MKRFFGLALAIVAMTALTLSHYLIYRKGQTDVSVFTEQAMKQENSAFHYNRLTASMRTLRPVAQHPDAISASDRTQLVKEMEDHIRVIKQEYIPELRQAGNDVRVRKYAEVADRQLPG